MINKISIVACLFLINNFVFCMDEGQITDKYELNRKAYVEITSASCNKTKLKKIFDEGADPK